MNQEVKIGSNLAPSDQVFASCFHELKFYWPSSFGSRQGSAPAKRHKHSTELEAQTFSWPLWVSGVLEPLG